MRILNKALFFLFLLLVVSGCQTKREESLPMVMEESWFGMTLEEIEAELDINLDRAEIGEEMSGGKEPALAYTPNDSFLFWGEVKGNVTFFFSQEKTPKGTPLGFYGIRIIFPEWPREEEERRERLKELAAFLETDGLLPLHHGNGDHYYWDGETYETLARADDLEGAYERLYGIDLFFESRWNMVLDYKKNGTVVYYMISDLLPIYAHLHEF